MFKKKLVPILIGTLIALGTSAFFHNPVSAAGTNGWSHSGSYWKYSINGSYAKGWLLDNGKWYYLAEDGSMKIGWSLQSSKWYYLNDDGSRAQKSWILYGNKWYYLDSNGQMAVNTTTPDGYLVGTDGAWTGKTDTTMAPENLTATSGSSSTINLQWAKSGDDDYYYVYYSLDNKTFTPIVSSDDDKRQFQWNSNYSASLSGLAPETKVYFKITAVRDGVESKYSSVVNATTNEGTLLAPTGLDAEVNSYSNITLTWNEIKGADYYNIYYRTSTASEYTKVKQTSNSMTLTGLSAETEFYFKVTAVNGKIESAYSKTVSAVTDEYYTPAPTGVKAQATSYNSIKVTWTKVSGAAYYYVYYKLSKDDDYTTEKCVTNSYTLTDLEDETKVYFKVTAVEDDDESSYSTVVNATTGDVDIDKPTGVKTQVVSSSSIELYWDKVTGANYYNVYYRESSDGDYTKVKRTTNYFILNSLDSKTKFYFRVTAVAGELESSYNTTLSATTNSD